MMDQHDTGWDTPLFDVSRRDTLPLRHEDTMPEPEDYEERESMVVVREPLRRIETIDSPQFPPGRFPVGTYADGTTGWSGSDTSRDRAEHELLTGIASKRQIETLVRLSHVEGNGLTVKELGHLTGWHHGQASAALSNLHKAGRIARLVEKRGFGKGRECHVYVLAVHINGRDVQPHGRKAPVEAEPDSDQYQAGWSEGRGVLLRQLNSILNRHPLTAGSRLVQDIRQFMKDG